MRSEKGESMPSGNRLSVNCQPELGRIESTASWVQLLRSSWQGEPLYQDKRQPRAPKDPI